MRKQPEELYAERVKRFKDTIELKETDRVVVAPLFQFFLCSMPVIQ